MSVCEKAILCALVAVSFVEKGPSPFSECMVWNGMDRSNQALGVLETNQSQARRDRAGDA